MENISILLILFFILTTFITVWLFYRATQNAKKIVLPIVVWMLFQAILGLTGFYQVTDTTPPRFILLLGPVFIFITILFLSKGGKKFIDSLDSKQLTLLHTVRIPVEIVLYYVFLNGLIPMHMTFEGYNFDIISGVTAPIMYYLVFVSKKANRKTLLIWNFLCLGLLINILTIAILSAQTPLQKIAFEQPNIGVTYFPFVWLPTIIVPLVLLSHLASIRQLLNSGTYS